MNDSLFLVDKEDYTALIERLVKEKMETELIEDREFTYFKVKSKQTGEYICSCKSFRNGTEPEYYIFNLPLPNEWTAAKPKRKVELTEEESKLFWEELIKATEAKKNDGIIS